MFGWCCVGIRSCTQEKLDATSFFAYTCCTRVPAHRKKTGCHQFFTYTCCTRVPARRKKNWIPPGFLHIHAAHEYLRTGKTGCHQFFFAYTRCTRVCGQACMYEQSNISIVFFLHRIFNAVDGHTIRIQKIVYTSRFVRVILAQGPC